MERAALESIMTTEKNAPLAPLEEGEISEIERLKCYYARAIETAAEFIVFAEQFVPCLERLQNYSIPSIRHMRAQCRTAMRDEDVIAVQLQRETGGFWHGPNFPSIPRDMSDLDEAIISEDGTNSCIWVIMEEKY